ncbi:site-specific integrase [Filobacillus milosensis]|uniref:Site-specific integrase n=1 Tax=Filobacillus milosensis TaxID=94137 RepID=A0A4Y8IFU0_9BACI|nr:site-specific integrase [Filobacillus milosensis]TFB13672.1 site-specific integrase [Filobacillus milosensis]
MELIKKTENEEVPLADLTDYNYISEFLSHLNIQNVGNRKYQKNIIVDFYLYHGKGWKDLTVHECHGYFDYLKRVHEFKKISEQVLIKKVKLITQYLNYLHDNKAKPLGFLNSLEQHAVIQQTHKKKTPNIRKGRLRKEKEYSRIINDFRQFLESKNYRVVENIKRVVVFERFLEEKGININTFLKDNQETLLINCIQDYEKVLSERIVKEEIKASTARVYLQSIQQFVKFLFSRNLVKQKYRIPCHLRGRSNRANEYVPKDSIIKLMNTIYDHSHHVIRDLAIFLIIVDTGCRPIEVENLTIDDFDKVERTLSFKCKKSEKRKIKISPEVIQVINDYMEIREQYHPQTKALIVNCSGQPISTSSINMIFYDANVRTFGESRYSAKAFRHTYITNALQEYSFERVAKIVGHNDWKSTNYYYYRSNQRLLANTLDYSPLKNRRK